MQNARLDEAQVGIKIARKNINDFTYAAKSKGELKEPIDESEIEE